MDYLRILYAVIPVLIALIISMHKDDFLAVIRAKTITDYEKSDLVIAVISARHHYENRQAIRDTWWGNQSVNNGQENKIFLKFVIGQSCAIHPDYRSDEYGCTEWNISLPEYYEDIPLVVETTNNASNQSKTILHYGIPSFSFRVHHPIVVSKLGIHNEVLMDSAVSVKLIDSVTRQEVVSASFIKSRPGVLIQGFRYMPVEPYILPKGYEGTVVMEQDGKMADTVEMPLMLKNIATHSSNNITGIVEIYQDDQVLDSNYIDPEKSRRNPITLSTLLFNINDVSSLQSHVGNRAEKTSIWRVHMKNENIKLHHEAEVYDDVLFVNTVDVYRNIPDKLIQAMVHFNSGHFKHFLKTDDDCYIDTQKVMSAIHGLNVKKLWFGRFRNNWMVEHYGKWAENEYYSMAYPRFACGSGYVISQDIVQWIVDNSENLKLYQGEDVSMGIWLAAIGPTYKDDPEWQCFEECTPDLYSLPEQSSHELRQLWANKVACDNPCGC